MPYAPNSTANHPGEHPDVHERQQTFMTFNRVHETRAGPVHGTGPRSWTKFMDGGDVQEQGAGQGTSQLDFPALSDSTPHLHELAAANVAASFD